jgi:drug/metabolite transporter (DMT)-like permease
VWYAALPRLTATRAATLQLTVPVLAALGGLAFLAESISTRLVLASLLVLGGVALAILGRRPDGKT